MKGIIIMPYTWCALQGIHPRYSGKSLMIFLLYSPVYIETERLNVCEIPLLTL